MSGNSVLELAYLSGWQGQAATYARFGPPMCAKDIHPAPLGTALKFAGAIPPPLDQETGGVLLSASISATNFRHSARSRRVCAADGL